MTAPAFQTAWRTALVAAAVSLIAYAPFLSLPLISDDYLQIGLARHYGSWEGQQELFADALYRCRATSLWLTWAFDRLFGPGSVAINLFALAIHVLNCMLVFAMGRWERIGWRVSAAAAIFFAVYEGHQEAVIWFAALPELLVFFFGLLTLVAWSAWLERREVKWLVATFAAYLLCLLSKESGVVVMPLMAGYAWARGQRSTAAAAPLALLAVFNALYAWSIFEAQSHHLHFNDGTFSLDAPFHLTLAISAARLLWFWGLVALIAGLASRAPEFRALLTPAAVWIAITFLPYMFLTYMPRVPSRHTYFASAGLAILVGAAYVWAIPRFRVPPWARAALIAGMLLHNSLYLWVKKLPQYRERARATQELLEYAGKHPGPVSVSCFPYGDDIIYHSLQISGGRRRDQIRVVKSDHPPAEDSFCHSGQP